MLWMRNGKLSSAPHPSSPRECWRDNDLCIDDASLWRLIWLFLIWVITYFGFKLSRVLWMQRENRVARGQHFDTKAQARGGALSSSWSTGASAYCTPVCTFTVSHVQLYG